MTVRSPVDWARNAQTYHRAWPRSPAPNPRGRGSTAVQEWRGEASVCPSSTAASRKEKYSIWMLERAAGDPVEAELMIGKRGRR